MSRTRTTAALVVLLLAAGKPSPARVAGTPFSQDSATAALRHLVREIGPRPMGSPGERRALLFAAERFRAAGCDTAYVMTFTDADGVNTASGTAVGISRGRTGRIIVLGGHLDSSGPEIPGANDDGSGTAVVLEAARVLATRDNASTLVFCAWGGEERGLHGSGHFVKHFPLIDSVVLMLQVDMANGGRTLGVDPDAPRGISAPSWLLEAAYDVYYRELGYADLDYPTAVATLNSLGQGMYGSDHTPFLEAGIPAIDFTSDITDPIHTPLDDLRTFDPSGLKRSGDLVVRLVERFDGGTPSRTTERHLPLQFGSSIVIVPWWALWAFLAVTAVAVVAALRRLARHDRSLAGPPRVRFSGLKALAGLIVLSIAASASETLAGALFGYASPWVNNVRWYLLLGAFATLAGVWLWARMGRRWPVGPQGLPMMVRALVLLVPLAVIPGLRGPEGALFAAWPLFFLSSAVLARAPLAKIVLSLLSFVPLAMVLGSDLAVMLMRMATTDMMPPGALPFVIREALFVALTVLVFLPHAFGLAAVYRSREGDWLRLASLGRPVVLLAAAAGMAALLGFLSARPVYGGTWHVPVTAEQRGMVGDTSSLLTIRGGDRLGGLRLREPGKDTLFTDAGRVVLWKPAASSLAGIASVTPLDPVEEEPVEGAGGYRGVWTIRLDAPEAPYKVEVSLAAESAFTATSPFVFARSGRGTASGARTLQWYSFPAMPLEVPVTVSAPEGTRIVRTVTMTFASLPSGVTLERENTYFIPRTVVTWRDTTLAQRRR